MTRNQTQPGGTGQGKTRPRSCAASSATSPAKCFPTCFVLVLDLAGMLHRGTGFRVQAAGLLVMNTAQVVNTQ
jgi:hypothetical protein